MQEQWKVIVGFPNYAVSNLGRVKRLTPAPHTRPGKILTVFKRKDGYAAVTLHSDGPHKTAVHRLVAFAFLGQPPEGKTAVAHADGDRMNAEVSNLRWATTKENHADRKRHGTHFVGEDVSSSVLTEAAVRRIRDLTLSGTKQRDLASIFGVCQTTIWNVVNNRTWTHV